MKARIVPAIDLIDGRCVRLKQGAFSESEVVGEDPLTVAKGFEAAGFSRLHLVDLSGAKSGEPKHLGVLEQIAAETSMVIDYSGGLRRADDVRAALERGAKQVVIGSAAVTQRSEVESWFASFGGETIILGLDVEGGRVKVHGWQTETNARLNEVIEWYLSCNLHTVMSTDITRDGMMAGPSDELYRSLRADFQSLRVIASGGVTTPGDVERLAGLGVSEIIVGKALYAGTIKPADVAEWVW